MAEPRRFIQIVLGPRQVGKTTLVRQVLEHRPHVLYVTADDPGLRDSAWLAAMWQAARTVALRDESVVLVVDEVQKVDGWAETTKRLWDEDTLSGESIRVVLLGSAALAIQTGLTESLAGRFEVIRLAQWTYAEMHGAFGWGLEQYLRFGGYPGAVGLVDDPDRWRSYMLDALIETTLSRDLLFMTRVDKPALLRQLFRLGCDYSGQVISYQKLTGQLQDAGNTVTLAHYLRLLAGVGLLTGLEKHAPSRLRQRASSPKLLALDPAIVTAMAGYGLDPLLDPVNRGRAVETAIGAHLVNTAPVGVEIQWWREGQLEVDYVVSDGHSTVAIEVASGPHKPSLPGLGAFVKAYPQARPLLIGGQGIPLEDALSSGAGDLLG